MADKTGEENDVRKGEKIVGWIRISNKRSSIFLKQKHMVCHSVNMISVMIRKIRRSWPENESFYVLCHMTRKRCKPLAKLEKSLEFG